MALRVFISHSNVDTTFAERLASDLHSAGADVWLDATHIGSGNFVQRINEAINARDVLVLILTPDALTSRWVPDEMDAALVRYKQGFMQAPIIVLAKPVPLRDIPALWTTYNRLDATGDYARALPGIARALGLTLPPPVPPPATPGASVSSPHPQPATPKASGSKQDAERHGRGGSSPEGQAAHQRARSADRDHTGVADVTPQAASPSVDVAMPTRPAHAWPQISRRSFLIGAGATVMAATGIGGLAWYTHAQATGAFRLRWRTQVGGKLSAPAVANGLVYVGADDSNVYALDAHTGARRWTFQADGKVSPPAVADGFVYVSTFGGTLYALDANAGTMRWHYHAGGDDTSPPFVADGIVYVQSEDGNLYALDAQHGTKRWTFETGTAVPSFNVPAVASGLAYVATANYSLCAIDCSSGSQRWSFSWPYDSVSNYGSSPAVANGLVYFGSSNMTFYAIDAKTGTKRWGIQVASGILTDFSAPSVVNGMVCFGLDAFNKVVYGLDAQTGAQRWKYIASGAGVPRLTAANGVLFVSEADNNVFAFEPSTGAKLWTFQVDGSVMYDVEGLEGASPPAVANGLVYVGADDGYVYAITA